MGKVLAFPFKEAKTAVEIVGVERKVDAVLDEVKEIKAEAQKTGKWRWRSKTLWFHVLTLVLSLLGYIPLDPMTVIMLQAVIGILLRFLTDKPIYG